MDATLIHMDATLMGPVIVFALLVIRTAMVEIHRPGSARRQWGFLGRRGPMTAGATVAVLLSVSGRYAARPATVVVWALLAGALVAHIVHLSLQSQAKAANHRKGRNQ